MSKKRHPRGVERTRGTYNASRSRGGISGVFTGRGKSPVNEEGSDFGKREDG